VIDALCSDHQPHDADAKLAPFPSTEPGRADLAKFRTQAFRLVQDGYVPLARLIDAVTTRPNQILGLPAPVLPSLDIDPALLMTFG